MNTILSQNTTDITSKRAFESLKAAFPTWRGVLHAPEGAAEDAVRCGGLAEIKMDRVRLALTTLLAESRTTAADGAAGGRDDEPSLEHVRALPTEAAKRELTRFKGVGPKTASCVLMFALDRAEFPVDTHVCRIARDVLRWTPAGATRESTYAHLNARVPDALKYDLHCLLVRHGKCCKRCAANGQPRRPPVGPCPLVAAGGERATTAAASVAIKSEEAQVAKPELAEASATAPRAAVKAEVKTEAPQLKAEAAQVKVEAA